jgi:hypothetical protein
MRQRYDVNLTDEERAWLTELTRRARVSGLKRLRALILLGADDDLTDQEIAEGPLVGVRTVERVRKRCMDRGVAAALERKPQEHSTSTIGPTTPLARKSASTRRASSCSTTCTDPSPHVRV